MKPPFTGGWSLPAWRTDAEYDLMNRRLPRNCLSNWMKRPTQGTAMSKDESLEVVYGMPYEEWRTKYQKDASAAQKAAFEKTHRH